MKKVRVFFLYDVIRIDYFVIWEVIGQITDALTARIAEMMRFYGRSREKWQA